MKVLMNTDSEVTDEALVGFERFGANPPTGLIDPSGTSVTSAISVCAGMDISYGDTALGILGFRM